MSPNKTFDCVDTKNRVQQELQAEWKGLSGAEIQDRIERDLATSDSPAARWWRSLGQGPGDAARVRSSSEADRK